MARARICFFGFLTMAQTPVYSGPTVFYPQAIATNRRSAVAYNNRGNMRMWAGDYANAFADFDSAIRLLPDYALAHYNRGTIHAMHGRYQEAVIDMSRSIQLRNEPDSYYNRAWAYSRLGEYP